MERYVKRHAAYVIKAMRSMPSGSDTEQLRRHCVSITGHHTNTGRVITLYHVGGREETGDIKQLMQKTGMTEERVRDLFGRRDYVKGWCSTKERALEGRRKPGPQPKQARMVTGKTESRFDFFEADEGAVL